MAKLRCNFPSDDKLWEAESASEWDRLRKEYPLYGPFFPELLDQFAASDDDSVVRKIRNLRHLKLLMNSVARMQWTWKEIPATTPHYFANGRAWRNNNNVATDTARLMSWLSKTIYNSLKTSSTTGDTHLAVANLHIAHMSHLQSSGELLDWLHPFLRGDTPERDRVKHWRNRWAFQSLSRVRQAAFNCGQLMGLARRYPLCFVQQPYCTFHAGTILWSIAPFLNGTPEDAEASPVDVEEHQSTVVLDKLPRLDALDQTVTPAFASAILQEQRELTEWLQPPTEDDATYKVAIHDVPDISTRAGRRRILEITIELLNDPAAPAIAQRFSSVIECLVAGRNAEIHQGMLSRKHMMYIDS